MFPLTSIAVGTYTCVPKGVTSLRGGFTLFAVPALASIDTGIVEVGVVGRVAGLNGSCIGAAGRGLKSSSGDTTHLWNLIGQSNKQYFQLFL